MEVKRARRLWRAASEPTKPRKAGAVGGSQLGVTFNAQVSFHFYPGIRSTGQRGLSQGWKSAGWLVQPIRTHSQPSRLAAGNGSPMSDRRRIREGAPAPRPRCGSNFREPYNLCLQATVGVKDIIINEAVEFAHRA